jgi:hypothetical protein
MRRIGSIVPAVLVGLPFAISVGAVSEESSWRFWGVFFGGFLMALTFGTTLWVSGRKRPRLARIGRVIVLAVLLVFGLGTANWIYMWGVPLFTLEGAWMYPLAIVPLSTVVVLVLAKRHASKSDFLWTRPPDGAR